LQVETLALKHRGSLVVIMHRFVARSRRSMFADGSELHDTQLGGDAGGKTRYDPDADVKK